MKKITLLVILLVFMVFALPMQAGAKDKVKEKDAIPIWQIMQDGTDSVVNWVNADNPRFAIYDPGTPGDETDDIVHDKETDLVWERSPRTTTHSSWSAACHYCFIKEMANRKGWRPPTIAELASLVDNDDYNPPLPPGHPFINVLPYYYWSSTTFTGDVGKAWAVVFSTGYLHQFVKEGGTFERYVWCVRGGQGHDGY